MALIRWNISHVIQTQVEKTYPDGLYLFYFYSHRLLRQAKPKTPTRGDDSQTKWQGWPRFTKSLAFIFKAYLLFPISFFTRIASNYNVFIWGVFFMTLTEEMSSFFRSLDINHIWLQVAVFVWNMSSRRPGYNKGN